MKRAELPKKDPVKKAAGFFTSSELIWPIGIFAFAFLIRLVYLLQIKSSLPFFYAPIMDELYHDTLADR
ncbi:MAG: hypothetical protein WCE90_02630 [Candidatus Zixiibacteriota bacterium]